MMLKWLRRTLGMHEWEYHNPYDRTCKVCGRHEVEHCRSLDTWAYGWWEVFREGDPALHNKKEAK